MYARILLATDGSEHADAAARSVSPLAAAFDAAVHILSVVDTRSYSERLADLDELVRAQREELEARADDAVSSVETAIGDDLETTTAVEHGPPYAAIPRYAADHDIDLVAMGTHGHSGLDRVLLGSVTERVVRTSEVPVLAVPPLPTDGATASIDSILVPVDGSATAEAAVEHALAIAERRGASVDALAVASEDGTAPSRLEAEAAVEAVVEQASARGVPAHPHLQPGPPHERICDFVDEQNIDLVAMGTHGHSGIARTLLGGVTEKVLRTSNAPVLTVRLPPE